MLGEPLRHYIRYFVRRLLYTSGERRHSLLTAYFQHNIIRGGKDGIIRIDGVSPLRHFKPDFFSSIYKRHKSSARVVPVLSLSHSFLIKTTFFVFSSEYGSIPFRSLYDNFSNFSDTVRFRFFYQHLY